MIIPFNDLIKGGIYEVVSRNINPAVFTGEHFIGVRQKFDHRYLDIEFYRYPAGTVLPRLLLGHVPADIPLTKDDKEYGTKDQISGRSVAFDKPTDEGGKGWYFTDTGESSEKIRPASKQNKKLFDYLNGALWRE